MLEYDIKIAPESKVSEWVVYACLPPTLERQSVSSVRMKIKGSELVAEKVCEKSLLKRSVLRIRQPAGTDYLHELPVREEFSAILNEAKLLVGAPKKPAKVLSKNEKDQNLISTFSLDYKSNTFQNWLAENNLHKSSKESDLEFAWRTYICIRSKYRYFWTQSLDRRISNVCLKFATDCGGLSYLFCGVLRANGVPARPLIGRWAHSSAQTEDYSGAFNCHVKSEFYLAGVGWVPVDISQAVSNRRDDPRLYFGNDHGDFIVMHENPDLVLDSLHHGLKNIRSMPDFRVWLLERDGASQIPREIVWKVSRSPVK